MAQKCTIYDTSDVITNSLWIIGDTEFENTSKKYYELLMVTDDFVKLSDANR